MSLGNGYRNVKLGDLLPLRAIQKIERLRNTGNLNITVLKQITGEYRAHLLDLGVDSDYLAYLLAHALGVK